MSRMSRVFYKNRAALNVLTNSLDNASAIVEAAQGHVIVGILSKNYPDAGSAIAAMRQYGAVIDDAVSIGLGGGDNRQAAVVSEIVKSYAGAHINQIFPAVGATRANLGERNSWINALVSPCGQVGYVNISTGVYSAAIPQQAIVPVQAAIALVRDMGGDALKYYPMNALAHEAEYRAVAAACGEARFALEPTGGITPGNFEAILEIALQAGVPQVIPHVYTSIIDSHTGATQPDAVETLYGKLTAMVDRYA